MFITAALFLHSCKPAQQRAVVESEFKASPIVLDFREVETLPIGASMPEFTLPDIYGDYVSSSDLKKSDVLVVAFISNHCPTSQAYEDRLIAFTSDYNDKGVKVVAINPNSPLALLPEECGYSDLDDSFETMFIRAEDKGYNFPYLYDGDNHGVSLLFGPVTTPHFFVFDKFRKLRYNGRMDGIERPGSANGEDIRLAVDQVLTAQEVSNPVTATFGCSVKWSWKSEWANTKNQEWKNKPVLLKFIDDEGVEEIMSNKGNKLRLVSVWASWCGPCVIEMPDLVELQRFYGNRAFELITISADNPGKMPDALHILETRNVAVDNFLYANLDKQQLVKLIDSEWRGLFALFYINRARRKDYIPRSRSN
jgi:thiol-disulfide isomerase/thioredoxin